MVTDLTPRRFISVCTSSPSLTIFSFCSASVISSLPSVSLAMPSYMSACSFSAKPFGQSFLQLVRASSYLAARAGPTAMKYAPIEGYPQAMHRGGSSVGRVSSFRQQQAQRMI
jgi:hypothetical protein